MSPPVQSTSPVHWSSPVIVDRRNDDIHHFLHSVVYTALFPKDMRKRIVGKYIVHAVHFLLVSVR